MTGPAELAVLDPRPAAAHHAGAPGPSVRGDVLACAAALAVVTIFFYEPLTGDRQFYHSDVHALHYPLRELVATELRNGRLPLWDPSSMCGYPVVASYISAVFLPQNALYLILPFDWAFRLLIVSKHLLAVVFQFLFLRRIGLAKTSSAAGGIAFALAGPLLSISDFHHFAFECFPLMLWAWWRVLDRPGGGRFDSRWVVAVLAFTFAFLHGDLQTLWAGGILALLLPLAMDRDRRTTFRKSTLLLGCLVAASVALGAVQLLPAAELLPQTSRVSLSTEERFIHSLSPGGIAEIAVPYSQRATTDFIAYKYLGLSTLLLAAYGVISALRRRSTRRLTGFFLATALVAFLLALGDHVPLLEPLSHVLPGLDLFRYPQKWLGLVAVATATLCAVGISEIVRARCPRLALLAALIVALDLLLAGAPFLDQRLVAGEVYRREVLPRLEEKTDRYTGHDRMLRLPTNGLLAGLRLPPASSFETLDEADADVRRRTIAWNIQTLLGNNAYRAGARRVSGVSSFSFQSTETLWKEAARRGAISKVADLMAARWVLTTPDDARVARSRPGLRGVLPAGPPAARWETALGELLLFERPSALPRALVVADVQMFADDDALVDALFGDRFDPRGSVLIRAADAVPDVDPPAADASRTDPAAGNPPPGTEVAEVLFVEDGLASVTLDVTSRGARGRYLVVNDSFASGWTARVDGRITPVLRANHFARAVPLPAGPCRVELTYEPRALRVGAFISFGALLALTFMLVRAHLPRVVPRSL